MLSLLSARWAAHPWLTGLELAAGAVLAAEAVLLAHVVLGWAWGVATHDPDAMIYTRFVFLTGEDARFGAGMVALLALVPLSLVLLLVGGLGAGWAAHVGSPLRPFAEVALLGGVGILVSAVVLLASTRSLGGGILPH
jgi:hypothetical protein